LIALAVLAFGLLVARGAQAHGVLRPDQNLWTAWNLTPEVTLGTLLVAGLYMTGLWRRQYKTDRAHPWRHFSFFIGLAAIFLALQSPIDAIAERIFLVHQVQHLLLRMIGPLALFLAAPQALLIAGTPAWAQRRIVAPILTNGTVRNLFGMLTHPALVTALFIGTLYFWQIPRFHNQALLNDAMHYLMHVSMLIPGLLFFWRIFDSRPAPKGTRYGVRIMMLWVMILSNIVIGSYLAFKQVVLYSAYAELGRIWDISAQADELFGGAFIWIPSSMMGVVTVLIVVHMWGNQETKDESRRTTRLLRQGNGQNNLSITAADLYRQTARRNRVMALGYASFVIVVFTTAITIGIFSQIMGS